MFYIDECGPIWTTEWLSPCVLGISALSAFILIYCLFYLSLAKPILMNIETTTPEEETPGAAPEPVKITPSTGLVGFVHLSPYTHCGKGWSHTESVALAKLDTLRSSKHALKSLGEYEATVRSLLPTVAKLANCSTVYVSSASSSEIELIAQSLTGGPRLIIVPFESKN